MEPNFLAKLYDDDSGGGGGGVGGVGGGDISNMTNGSVINGTLVDRFEMFFHNCSSHKHCLNVTDAEIDEFCQYTIYNDIDDKCCSDAISSVETYARVLLSNYYFVFNILLMGKFQSTSISYRKPTTFYFSFFFSFVWSYRCRQQYFLIRSPQSQPDGWYNYITIFTGSCGFW